MSLGKTAQVAMLSASIIGAALIIAFGPNNQAINTTDAFDFATIRTAEAAGANALFLKVDGMPGSSSNTNHKDEIELLWYCFGFSSRTDIPGCNADEGKSRFGITDFDGFHFIMGDNKATPKLMTAYLGNSTISTVTFSAQRGTSFSGGTDYLTVTLSDVKVTSYFHASREQYSIPVVEASMTFSKIQMQYSESSQIVKAGWDFTTNTPL